MDRLHEGAPHTAAAVTVYHRDRHLRRLLVDEALAVLRLGEVSEPGETERRAVLVGDEARVARMPPSLHVEGRHLRMLHPVAGRQLNLRIPRERGVEHLQQERRLVRAKVTDLHGVGD